MTYRASFLALVFLFPLVAGLIEGQIGTWIEGMIDHGELRSGPRSLMWRNWVTGTVGGALGVAFGFALPAPEHSRLFWMLFLAFYGGALALFVRILGARTKFFLSERELRQRQR